MSKGLLGKAMTQVNTNVSIYTAPPTVQFTTANINIVNMDAAEATVKIAITTSVAPAAADYVDFGSKIPPLGGVLQRECFLMSPNEKIFVHSSNSNCAVRVDGLEEM